MKHSPQRENVLHALHHLPRKMLKVHDHHDGAAFVLHELCHPECFDVQKAAYLVNNPDFDCVQGIAGISRDEGGFIHNIAWDHPDEFSSYIETSPFHQQVRQLEGRSLDVFHERDSILSMGKQLGFKHADCYVWDLKHNNHGILVFERPETHEHHDDLMKNSVYFLSFCPVH